MHSLGDDEQQVVDLVMKDPRPERLVDAVDLDQSGWKTWGDWVRDHPQVTQVLFDSLRTNGVPREQALDAVCKWVADSGKGLWQIVGRNVKDNEAMLSLFDLHEDTPMTFTVDLGQPDAAGMEPLDAPTLKRVFSETERHFLLCSTDAPLMVITYQQQVDSSDPGTLNPQRMTWVAGDMLYFMSTGDRNEMMERDTDASDMLRQDAASPGEAEEWEGMFWCEGRLHRAGSLVQALRSSLGMNSSLPAPQPAPTARHRM